MEVPFSNSWMVTPERVREVSASVTVPVIVEALNTDFTAASALASDRDAVFR